MRRAGLIAAVLAGALALTGCGGPAEQNDAAAPEIDVERYDPEHPGNGLWLVPQGEVIDQITRATREAGAVRVEGSVTELVTPEEGDPFPGRSLSVSYVGTSGAMEATVRAGDVEARIVAVDGATYVTGNARYASHVGTAELADGWVCAASPEALLAEWAPLLDPADLVETLLTGADAVSVMEPPAEADQTTVYLGSGDAPEGRMTVSAVDAPLPHQFIAGDGTGDGEFTFTDWGVEPKLAEPGPIVTPCD